MTMPAGNAPAPKTTPTASNTNATSTNATANPPGRVPQLPAPSNRLRRGASSAMAISR
jgi:hypothetical protein